MSYLTSCPDEDALRHFAVGDVPEMEAGPLELHLAGCPRCVATLHDVADEDTLVAALRAQSSLTSRPRIDEAVTSLITLLKSWSPSLSAPVNEEPLDFLTSSDQPGELGRFGGYRVLRVLGSGGMGIVFEAEDTQLRRPVALKVLRPMLASSGSARKRFLREARAAAKINHPHVVNIYQVGEERGIPFLAMPFLDGETLEARLRAHGPLPLADIRRIGSELADGLAAAHAEGVLHRDIKPANIWLESLTGSTRLLDFGLAWAADDADVLTAQGTVIGTPAYMAPEQARGEPADVRSDLFSLGSVLYALCTGRAPFQAESNFGTLEKVRTEAPQPIRDLNPKIPPWLASLIARLHAKEPSERWQSARDVQAALLQGDVCGESGAKNRRSFRGRWIAAALLILPILGLAICEATGLTYLRALVATRQADPDAGSKGTELPAAGRPPGQADVPLAKAPMVYPAALFAFEERGTDVKGMGAKVTDLLFARLAVRPDLYLVDRSELKKILGELELNITGAVKMSEANRIGQLTGAKIMISGSVLRIDKRTYLVAKILGTETSKVLAASVDGKSDEELGPLVAKLGDQIADTVANRAADLVARPAPVVDRLANLRKKLKGNRPAVWLNISERPGTDRVAETELARFCNEMSFSVMDADGKSKADVLIVGTATWETASRTAGLVGAKARIDIKAIERATDKVLVSDSQTALVVDLTEQLAGKAAAQEAAAILAERILPKLTR